jgi:hypothetical protein
MIFVGRADVITEFIKRHDPLLYVDRREGKLCALRRGKRIESYDVDGVGIDFVRPAPHFVFALTENWSMDSRPVDWGLEPILQRLKDIDLWNRDLVSEQEKLYDKNKASRDRALDNHIESYLKDHRRDFARATNDVSTANMNKIDKRKTGEKDGYC